VPVGSVVDTRRGRVRLVSVKDGHDRLQTGTFWGGVFKVSQRRRRGAFTDLFLRGPRLAHCKSAGKATFSKRRKRRKRRHLWGRDRHGRFRTHGRNSVATTRGTSWVTEERCGGTLTRVKSGKVLVRVRHRRKKVMVSAGESYLARRGR
jgi:hypothetical protein